MRTDPSSFPATVWDAMPAALREADLDQCEEAEALQEAAFDKILKSNELYFFLHGPPCPDRSQSYLVTALSVCLNREERFSKYKTRGTIPCAIVVSPFEEDTEAIYRQAMELSKGTNLQISLLAEDGNANRDVNGQVHFLVAWSKHLHAAWQVDRVSMIRAEILILDEPKDIESCFYDQMRKVIGKKTVRYVFCGSQPRDENAEVFAKALDKENAPAQITTIGKDAAQYARTRHRWSAYVDADDMLDDLLCQVRANQEKTIIFADDGDQLALVENHLAKTLRPSEETGYRTLIQSRPEYQKVLARCSEGKASLILTDSKSAIDLRWCGAARIIHVGMSNPKDYVARACRAGDIGLEGTKKVTSHVYLVLSSSESKAARDIEKIHDLVVSYSSRSTNYRFPGKPTNFEALQKRNLATAQALADQTSSWGDTRSRPGPVLPIEADTVGNENEAYAINTEHGGRARKRDRNNPPRTKSNGPLRKKSRRSLSRPASAGGPSRNPELFHRSRRISRGESPNRRRSQAGVQARARSLADPRYQAHWPSDASQTLVDHRLTPPAHNNGTSVGLPSSPPVSSSPRRHASPDLLQTRVDPRMLSDLAHWQIHLPSANPAPAYDPSEDNSSSVLDDDYVPPPHATYPSHRSGQPMTRPGSYSLPVRLSPHKQRGRDAAPSRIDRPWDKRYRRAVPNTNNANHTPLGNRKPPSKPRPMLDPYKPLPRYDQRPQDRPQGPAHGYGR